MNDTKPPRVLVVDDNAVIRHIAVMNLRRFGIEADTAQTGQEAVEKYTLNAYDLILMDVAMPEKSGLEATQQIRQSEAGTGRRIPIVGVTASETRERCLSAGMDDYIIKPPDYERVLRQWLPEFFSKAG
jgi:CheY-like chemotaxis protein